MQHGGPEQTVKIDNIFADKVVQLSFVLPYPVAVKIFTRASAVVFSAGDIANWSIEPHIEIFTGVPRNLKAKIRRIATDIPILKASFDPFV